MGAVFDCSAYAVELVPAREAVPAAGRALPLFDEARPIDGRRASPTCSARTPPRLLQHGASFATGTLRAKRRPRIARALEEDPRPGRLAAEPGTHWGLRHALKLLRRVYEKRSP